MGSLGGLLGTAGGAAGSGFATPQSANIQKPVSTTQAQDSYTQNQNALAGQQSLLQALQGQQGLQNQSNVYGQLQNVAAGQGPNPAQAMLNQATGQNVSNQAALMAGQRGASQNVGLMARQAAQQGANAQQQAVGQGASLQAQQSLNALGAAGNLATTQAGQQIGQTNANVQGQQAEQQNLLNAIAAQNNSAVGQQNNINSVNGGLANTQLQGQQGLTGGILNSAGAALGLAGGGEVQRYASGSYVDSPPLSDDQWSSLQANPGAPPTSQIVQPVASAPSGPKSMFGQFLRAPSGQQQAQPGGIQLSDSSGAKALNQGMTSLGQGLAGLFSSPGQQTQQLQQPNLGDSAVNNLVPTPSLGGQSLGAAASAGLQMPSMGGYAGGGSVGSKLKQGGHVPGKPKVGGAKNSYKNDNVKALLSPGEIVLPRSVTQSKDPVGEAAKFVQAVLAKRKSAA